MKQGKAYFGRILKVVGSLDSNGEPVILNDKVQEGQERWVFHIFGPTLDGACKGYVHFINRFGVREEVYVWYLPLDQ